MHRRAAVPGPANPVVILVVVAGLILVALVSIAARGGASTTTAAPSPTAPNGVRAERDIAWRHVGGADLTLDAFLPARAASGRSAVLLIHGGGWQAGDKASLDPEAQRLAALGYDAFSINYRLAPAHPYPAAVDDVQAAVQWLRGPTQAQRFGLDPHRIGAVGSSAGAHLAGMLATLGHGPLDRGARVLAAVSWSGPMDFVDFPAVALTAQQQAAVRNDIGTFLGCLPAACPTTAKAASPITQVDGTDAPMLLVNSDAELVPVDQAQRMAAALQAAGVREELVVLHGHLHAAAYASQVWDQTVTFLGHELGSPKP
jgi:acetyl esterase/lipase